MILPCDESFLQMSEAFQCACLKAQVSQVCPEALASTRPLWGVLAMLCYPVCNLANVVPSLPVLLWASCSCVLFQRLCTRDKGTDSYLLSTSHVDFSELFLFCFECEWKVLGHFMWLRLSFFPPTGGISASEVSSHSWAWRADGHCLVTEDASACHLSETSFIYIVWGSLDFSPNNLEEELKLLPLDFLEFKLLEWIKDRMRFPKHLGCEIRYFTSVQSSQSCWCQILMTAMVKNSISILELFEAHL